MNYSAKCVNFKDYFLIFISICMSDTKVFIFLGILNFLKCFLSTRHNVNVINISISLKLYFGMIDFSILYEKIANFLGFVFKIINIIFMFFKILYVGFFKRI